MYGDFVIEFIMDYMMSHCYIPYFCVRQQNECLVASRLLADMQ